jgi:uncharacterized damage-inducible protein DinB
MNTPLDRPEAWLRGPIRGVPELLQPVAHALQQAQEDCRRLAAGLDSADLWHTPGGAASVGFHLRHMAGSLDRLLAYARGEALSVTQREALAVEKEGTGDVAAGELLDRLQHTVEAALAQLRATDPGSLLEPRAVGRAGHPSTVLGLLFHAGEHTARHAGQISTTVRVLRGVRGTRE